MTIIERETIIDRPELVNRDDDEDEQDEEDQVSVIGEGGGPSAHGLEFEEDDLDIIAGANACAVLTTGQDSGEAFEQMFTNASVQLKDLKERNRDISMLSYFGLNNSIGTVGLTDEQSGELMNQLMESEMNESSESDDIDDSDIEEVEQEVEEMQTKDNEETA